MANVGMVIGRAEEQEGNATRGDVRDGRERMGDIWDIYGIYGSNGSNMDQMGGIQLLDLHVTGRRWTGVGSRRVRRSLALHGYCTDIARYYLLLLV